MKFFLLNILRRFGIVNADVLVRKNHSFPDKKQIAGNELIYVTDGGIDKWACLKCPGGCGSTIPLSLSKKRRPSWSIKVDILQRPTITPSVHQQTECGCHFWITNGKIQWCKNGKPSTP
ncbi:DUF6527 family protein [Serratia proteamaculans]|uniref:DUF6527 family protein n=1 Tax=Enterobacterales TaxID=91347 RepID=UPI000D7606DA|nr:MULTISPECIES: DUF6527 family protein [Enterobacteriaceae]EBB0508987.1 hypothetical protein [Salmonella enterica]EGC4559436.1 hypothetical protein [Escherichia coli]EKW9492725.1 hypothetical protein [Enterobacter hormaechei]HCD1870636.1 hypothetical protein [Enterobacter bugandensis]ELL8699389.1 hypothetical protein [Escherichia coli]